MTYIQDTDIGGCKLRTTCNRCQYAFKLQPSQMCHSLMLSKCQSVMPCCCTMSGGPNSLHQPSKQPARSSASSTSHRDALMGMQAWYQESHEARLKLK